MSLKHSDLNKKRTKEFRKSEENEAFLERFNNELQTFEESLYITDEPEHPFLFIFGLPRSGTTLLSQLIAHCLDVGFINNLAARFWKNPVTGIRFSRAVLDPEPFKAFESHYGATESLKDIHEFGYFWRDRLKKDSFEHIKNAHAVEKDIDWYALKRTLANMQYQFGKPMVFKNIFGSYHIEKLNEILGQSLWIYIERDSLDTAVSILKARKKYFGDPNIWWSYVPPEYEHFIDLDYWHQIAGQIHYLQSFYYGEMDQLETDKKLLRVTYADLCDDPALILKKIQTKLLERYEYRVELFGEPPGTFECHTYNDNNNEKKRFKKILTKFRDKD